MKNLIKSEKEYNVVLAEVERLIDLDPALGTMEGDLLDTLASIVENYEKENYPISTKENFIVVRTIKEGFHRWDDAPEHCSFLRNNHRHLFHIEVQIRVTELNRELEFFDVKREVDIWAKDFYKEGSNFSCEMMCQDLYNHLNIFYGNISQISIFEDNENGAVIKFD